MDPLRELLIGDTVIWNHRGGTSVGTVKRKFTEYWPTNKRWADVDTGCVAKLTITSTDCPSGTTFIDDPEYLKQYKMRVLKTSEERYREASRGF
jgi:hypothetical protein